MNLTPSEAVELGLTHIVAEDIKGKGYIEIEESVKGLYSKGKILGEQYQQYLNLVRTNSSFP